MKLLPFFASVTRLKSCQTNMTPVALGYKPAKQSIVLLVTLILLQLKSDVKDLRNVILII